MIFTFWLSLSLCADPALLHGRQVPEDGRVLLKDLHQVSKQEAGSRSFPYVLSLDLSIDLFNSTLKEEPAAFPPGGPVLKFDWNTNRLERILVGTEATTPQALFTSICDLLTELSNFEDGYIPNECFLPWSRESAQAIVDRRRAFLEPVDEIYVSMVWGVILKLYLSPDSVPNRILKAISDPEYFTIMLSLDRSTKIAKESMIADGYFGEVWKCRFDEEKEYYYAAKVIDVSSGKQHMSWISGEIENLKSVEDVRNVVQFHSAHLQTATEVVIVMEYLDGMDGFDFAERYDELDARVLGAIFREVLIGVRGIHELNLIHSDLKWENIHLGLDGRVTILDFGLAVDVGMPMIASTGDFAPPEYYDPDYEMKETFDLFQVGKMLHFALTLDKFDEKEFKGKESSEIRRLMKEQVDRELEEFVKNLEPLSEADRNMKDFINLAMWGEIMDANDLLNSPFINSAISREELVIWLKTNIPILMAKKLSDSSS